MMLSQLLQVHIFQVLNYGKYSIYLPFFVLILHNLYLVCGVCFCFQGVGHIVIVV
jgi:hypothetical protein